MHVRSTVYWLRNAKIQGTWRNVSLLLEYVLHGLLSTGRTDFFRSPYVVNMILFASIFPFLTGKIDVNANKFHFGVVIIVFWDDFNITKKLT